MGYGKAWSFPFLNLGYYFPFPRPFILLTREKKKTKREFAVVWLIAQCKPSFPIHKPNTRFTDTKHRHLRITLRHLNRTPANSPQRAPPVNLVINVCQASLVGIDYPATGPSNLLQATSHPSRSHIWSLPYTTQCLLRHEPHSTQAKVY